MAAYPNTTIIADQADVAGFMGKNVDAGFTVTMQDLVGVYAEAYLSNLVEFDIVTNFGSLNAVYKLMFSEYACRSIAVEAIKYAMDSFTTRIEAEDMINVHVYRLEKIEALLKIATIQDFMGV